jgi:FKBP-type peptidyl-prolyl cis-trans isomerase
MKLSYVLLAAVMVCTACSKTRKAPNGLEITVIREGEGVYAAPGQYVVLNMMYKDAKDSVWDDTRKRPAPMIFQIQDSASISTEKGIEGAFRVLKKGDSLMTKVSAKSFFEVSLRRPVPSNLKPESDFTFYFGVTDVTGEEGLKTIMEKLQSAEYEKSRSQRESQIASDSLAIDSYLATNKIDAIKASSGVRYVITKATKGERPTLASTIVFNYKGSLLSSGEVFQQSESPVTYPLTQLIKGWQIVFPFLSKGSKATLYIPSSLGYGVNGSPPTIPGNANLIFEVELVDFK